MEGGYINEEDSDAIIEDSPGGQLKTKNGQKYIVNDTREGIFVSKSCAVLTAIIAVLTLIVAILVTYFLVTMNRQESCPAVVKRDNATIATASMFGGALENEEGLFIRDEESKFVNKDIKLYDGWNPEIYWLVIEPNTKTSVNNGTVIIEVTRDAKVEGLQPIVLNIHNITILNTAVTRKTKDAELLEVKTAYGDNNETFIIKILSKVGKNEAVRVRLEFTSQLTDTLQGVYKTGYENVYTGETEYIVSTQFSPIDARRAFPCIDRPDKKANFSITLIRENDKTMTLSNMPEYFTSFDRPGYVKEEFEMSPKMPTYLVAFIVSNLAKSNYTDDDEPISPRIEIWTRPEVAHMTKYAHTFARLVFPFYEKFFGIPYKLSKIDLVSIPDFGFGAMENWGLVMFREAALLVPEGKDQSSSAEHTEYVSSIISHELAHQWLGNLVTPKWWDELWLKEGFATFMSYLAVDEIQPDWHILKMFAINEFQHAMEKDSDQSSRSISFPVASTNDIRRMFDPISYSKGAIILRMMNSFVGNEAFKSAIKDFLKLFAFGNAVQDDLWKLMTFYGHNDQTLPQHLNVKDIMDSWTAQAGYPVVTVERSGKDLTITQKRYLLPEKDAADESRWFIPITYETDEKRAMSGVPSHWMTKENKHIVIPNVFSRDNNSENYVFLNLNRYGYYRVNYDYPSWIVLKKRFKSLPPVTRAQLLDDSLNLARSEYLEYDIPLTFLLEMLTSPDDIFLWSAAREGLDYLTFMLNREPAFETFRAFMRYIVRPAFDKYGLDEPDNETHLQLMHRSRVAELACKFNYDRCTNAAQLRYREWMRDSKLNPIKPNLKHTIYCTALQEGSFHEWYFAYNRYKETLSASEKEQILSSLGCTTKPWLLSKYLNMTIDPTSGIRKQDGARAFSAVAKNSIGYEIAFDFLVTNIKEIVEYFGDGFSTLSKMIDSVTIYMNKDYHKEQLEKFSYRARKLGLKSIHRSIDLAGERVKNNIFWRKRSYYKLKGYLETIVKEFHINLY